MKPVRKIEGAILAGGRSRRMGSDKASLLVGELSMLQRVAAAMAPVASRIRVVGGGTADAGGYEVQPDLAPGMGPLSGIHAALATADAPAVLVVACDLPFVSSEFLARLCAQLTPAFEAVVPRVGGRAVPVCALYRTTCIGHVARCIERGELKAQMVVSGLATHYVDDSVLDELDPSGVCLKNINTPEELAQARAIASELK